MAKKYYLKNPLKRGYSKATVTANIVEMRAAGVSEKAAVARAYEEARKAWRKKHPRGQFPAHLREVKKVVNKNIRFKSGRKSSPRRASTTRGVVDQDTTPKYIIETKPGHGGVVKITQSKGVDRLPRKPARIPRTYKAPRGGEYYNLMHKGKRYTVWTRRPVRSGAEVRPPKGHLMHRDLLPAIKKNPTPGRIGRAYKRAVKLYQDFTGHDPKFLDEWSVSVPEVAMQVGKITGIMYTTKMDGKEQEFLHEFSGRSRPILAASADGNQLLILGGNYSFTDRGIIDGKVSLR